MDGFRRDDFPMFPGPEDLRVSIDQDANGGCDHGLANVAAVVDGHKICIVNFPRKLTMEIHSLCRRAWLDIKAIEIPTGRPCA